MPDYLPQSGTAEVSDVVNTLGDGIASIAAFIYLDLVKTEVLSRDEAVVRLRALASHMRDERHSATIVGGGIGLKLDDYAALLENAGEAKN